MERKYDVSLHKDKDAIICRWTEQDSINGAAMSIRFLTDVDFIDFCNVMEIAKQKFLENKSICLSYTGVLNEPHAKCNVCGKKEWEHKN